MYLTLQKWLVLTPTGVALSLINGAAIAQSDSQQRSDVKLQIATEYNSNVARSNPSRASTRGLVRADQRTTPSIQVDLARVVGSTQISLIGSAGYDVYARNDQLNRERIDLDLGLARSVGPCRLKFNAGFARRQSDLGDITFVNSTLANVVKNVETTGSYGGDLSCGGQYGFRPTGSVEFTTARNSNSIRDRAEYDSVDYKGGIEYVGPNFGEVLGFVSRRDITLRNQPAAAGATVKYNITTFGARYRRDIGSRLSAEATIGRSRIGGGGILVPPASSAIWNVNVTAQLGERFQIKASTGRQFANSLSSDSAYQKAQPNSIDLTYALNDRIRLQTGYSQIRTDYRYPVRPTGDFIERDTRQVLSGGMSYDFGRRWSFGLASGFERRNANGTLFDYKGSFVRGTLSLSL